MSTFETVTIGVSGDVSINVREIRPANVGIYNYYPDANNNPRGIRLADVVNWKCDLDVNVLPASVWESNDNPKRYRLGAYRFKFRNRFVDAGYITQKNTGFLTSSYSSNVDYMPVLIVPGTFPDKPINDELDSTYANASDLGADEIVINLIPGASAQLRLHYWYIPAQWSYFF